ncbi:MAG: 30S ribosomal protein S12 methylthiotransferase RimO [Desulfarculaceae bacterium]|nr:30S ribosomal protein S12 methylthiotransferase RimO [Desulfarculaceae bacterium]MCF8073620.1 30S ribosomal protein S12 methylthiotransferase RimO [Desulfarculaceae bacterium]MCF8103148.1 30S ribosomal protein S12 methylthiotransferase RimO [Desulfarculaceae bacterium]MCF8115664.1 30S ribosomal protein S12 methylthiotransferase RimO [Desulfarculaceae bacterium]
MDQLSGSYYLVNLGCAKNLVEGEHLAGLLLQAGWSATSDPAQADLLLVNTCGFIQPAVEEAVEAALELAETKGEHQRLVVAGCLVGRYGKKLAASLPEADLFIAPGEAPRLLEHLAAPPKGRLAISPPIALFGASDPRALSTGPGWAYLRVADGCLHSCAFCTIPKIRGRLRSRPLDDVVAEARALAAQGVKELNLVAQDLTSYGRDLGGPGLAELLAALSEVEGVAWLRPHYLHPDLLDRALIKAMTATPKVVPYFDLPLQHIADPVLQAMGRNKSGAQLKDLLAEVRALCPEAILRTTLLVGHPGEGEAEFAALESFVAQTGFDRLGVFAFSPEAGTRSARLPAPPPELALERQERIMELQRGISRERLARHKDAELPILVLGPHPDSDLVWAGRIAAQAPEVDGLVIITEGSAQPGAMAACRITATHDYDLEGVLI